MKTGIELITEERQEQIEKHGWTSEGDSRYTENQLIDAALQYLHGEVTTGDGMWKFWPSSWSTKWYKPGNRIDELKRAGALIAAEIDRLNKL